MTDNSQDEREIFICGSGGKTISYPATTIVELNPEKPVRAFALPAVIHMAAASLKGALINILVKYLPIRIHIYSWRSCGLWA